MPDPSVRLRPFREADLDVLDRFAGDPAFSEPFEWTGFRFSEGYRRRWEEDGFLEGDPHMLVVADAGDAAVGWVMWRDAMLGGEEGVGGWVTGILLAPEHRGRGIGTAAQRLLAEHLFSTTTAHRLSAYTEADNLPEQQWLVPWGCHRPLDVQRCPCGHRRLLPSRQRHHRRGGQPLGDGYRA